MNKKLMFGLALGIAAVFAYSVKAKADVTVRMAASVPGQQVGNQFTITQPKHTGSLAGNGCGGVHQLFNMGGNVTLAIEKPSFPYSDTVNGSSVTVGTVGTSSATVTYQVTGSLGQCVNVSSAASYTVNVWSAKIISVAP